MDMQNRTGEWYGEVDHLADPLRLDPYFRLGPVFTPRQSIRFHPNLDRPVQLDLDPFFVLHRNVSARTHIDTAR